MAPYPPDGGPENHFTPNDFNLLELFQPLSGIPATC
jgi:hypothetical protein